MSRSDEPLSVATSLSPVIPFFAASDSGFANSNGIVFSSINPNTHGQGTVLKPISNPISTFVFSNPIQTQISKPPDTSAQSSNFHHHAINSNTNYLQPINLPASHAHTNPVKAQAAYSSAGFTFAPLVAAISLPMIPQQTSNLTAQQNYLDNHVFLQQPTTSTTLPPVNHELADTVSMLKPINKCGITKYINSRVVGGSVTQIGIVQTCLSVQNGRADIKKKSNRMLCFLFKF